MNSFKNEIETLSDIESLLRKKNKIKDSVVSPHLKWQSRMQLYEQVQMINLRIAHLITQKSH